jgi:tetratricopeptide (TPR) repeat protein
MEEKSRKLNELFEAASKEMVDMNYEKAIELFTKVIEFDKNNNFICQASHFQRALASFNIGQFDAAFEDYKAFESMKKIVGNVLKDIEIPQVSRPKQDVEPKKPKKSKTKKKRKEVLPDEFEHDSLCNMLTQEESSSDKSSEVSAGEDEQGKEVSHSEAEEKAPVKTQEV